LAGAGQNLWSIPAWTTLGPNPAPALLVSGVVTIHCAWAGAAANPVMARTTSFFHAGNFPFLKPGDLAAAQASPKRGVIAAAGLRAPRGQHDRSTKKSAP
jgi:hypothetical protein